MAWLGASLNAQPPAQIAPLKVFDIQTVWAGAAPAGKVHRVRGGRSLYFHVSPSWNTQASSIVRTNGAGLVEQVIKLPEEAFIEDFAVDAAGAVYVELTILGPAEMGRQT